MQSAIIFVFIYAGIATRCATLVRCVHSGLLRSHAFFFAMATLSLARAIVSVTVNTRHYYAFYEATQWPAALLEAAAVLEGFWLIAAHFRKIRGFGWALFTASAAIATLIAASVAVLRSNWNEAVTGLFLFSLYTHIVLLGTALLSVAFFRQFPEVPIRPNAIRHWQVLCLISGSYVLATFIMQITRGKSAFITNLLATAGTTIAYGWWALRINREGEELPFPPPPEMPPGDFDAAEAEHKQAGAKLKKAGDDAIGRVLRP
jgi:hypothetical protein